MRRSSATSEATLSKTAIRAQSFLLAKDARRESAQFDHGRSPPCNSGTSATQDAQQEVAGAFWINVESGVLHAEEAVLRLGPPVVVRARCSWLAHDGINAEGCGSTSLL